VSSRPLPRVALSKFDIGSGSGVVWRGGQSNSSPTLFRSVWRLGKLTLFTDYDRLGTQQPMRLTSTANAAHFNSQCGSLQQPMTSLQLTSTANGVTAAHSRRRVAVLRRLGPCENAQSTVMVLLSKSNLQHDVDNCTTTKTWLQMRATHPLAPSIADCASCGHIQSSTLPGAACAF
jgi:hypothetical protein